MPFAYVTEQGASVHKEGRTLVVKKDGQQLAEWELVHLKALCLIGRVHLTTPAVQVLLKEGIETAFMTHTGRLLGQLTPPQARNVELRMAQYRHYEDAGARMVLARKIVHAKVANAEAILSRFARNHPEADLSPIIADLKPLHRGIDDAADLNALMGAEGMAARIYFQGLSRMCRGELTFSGRSSRPPRDPVNALLSLGYTFLVNELSSLLDAIGFDPYIGILHGVAYGRPSLALDLVEPFRHAVIDRFVLSLVNNRVVRPDDFEQEDGDEGVRLTRPAFHTFIRHYEKTMLRKRPNPFGEGQTDVRQIVRRQAEQLAATLTRGEPFVLYEIED